MGYLTLRFRGESGETVFQSDFTLHELIPLVRHITRQLVQQPEIAAHPTAYRALFEPRYDPLPEASPAGSASTWTVTAPPQAPPPLAEGSLLQISEEDVEVLAPVPYIDELAAFYAPGTSGLCLSCPERRRCPGSGAPEPLADLAGWIDLDPASPRSNQPVSYFKLRIETLLGRVLHQSDVRLGQLNLFIALVAKRVREAHGVAIPKVEMVAQFEGQPRVDPLLQSDGRVHIARRAATVLVEAAPSPPRRMVDWASLDQLEPPRSLAGNAWEPPAGDPPEAPEIDIKVFPTETEPLARRPPPASEPAPGAQHREGHLPIYLHRSVLAELDRQSRGLRSTSGGILVGEAFLDPDTDRPYVEVVAALPATDEHGAWTHANLDAPVLRQIRERIERDFPGRRTVGWYQFHLLRVALRTSGTRLTAGIVLEPLDLHEEEVFLHRNFFPQPWHLGLVIDTVDQGFCFYHLRDGEIAVSGDCRLVS